MRVRVERDSDRGMPKTLGHDLRVHALQQHERRMRVAKVVEAHGRKAVLSHQAPPGARERVRVDGRAILSRDQKVSLLPRLAVPLLLGYLRLPLALEKGSQKSGQCDRPTGASSLRSVKGQPLPGCLQARATWAKDRSLATSVQRSAKISPRRIPVAAAMATGSSNSVPVATAMRRLRSSGLTAAGCERRGRGACAPVAGLVCMSRQRTAWPKACVKTRCKLRTLPADKGRRSSPPASRSAYMR